MADDLMRGDCLCGKAMGWIVAKRKLSAMRRGREEGAGWAEQDSWACCLLWGRDLLLWRLGCSRSLVEY